MGHDHAHDDPKAYYVEQLCTIGIAGALGGIAVMLYQRQLLWFLAPKVQPWVLGGGIALLVLVAVRAVVVWFQAGKATADAHDHHHDHEHAHEHEHDQGHEGITAVPALGLAAHDHDHDHDHCDDHDHSHGHGNGDDHGHQHGWAPWRFVILLLPVVLYFLNMPNESMKGYDKRDAATQYTLTDRSLNSLRAEKVPEAVLAKLTPLKDKVVKTQEAFMKQLGEVLNPGEFESYQELAWNSAEMTGVRSVADQEQGQVFDVDFPELQRAPGTAESRKFYEGKTIRIKGEYLPGNERMFTLVRYRMNCCARDAVPLSAVIMIDPKSDAKLPQEGLRGKWVEVEGQVQFQQRSGPADTWLTIIVLRPATPQDIGKLVKETKRDGSYYLY